MKNRIVLVGKGASGKDHMRTLLEEAGLIYCISHTSRPCRADEENGKDYWFVSTSYFKDPDNKFYEYVEFNGWTYGTSLIEFRKSNLLIMTPSGISKLTERDRETSFIVYLDIDERIRRKRMNKRNDADSTDRRIESDEKDFKDFIDYDFCITNPKFGPKDAERIIENSLHLDDMLISPENNEQLDE